MQKLLCPIVTCVLLSFNAGITAQAISLGAVRMSFPVSFLLSSNEVAATRLELGAGFRADYFLWQQGIWHFGPGISLYGTLPAVAGNSMVAIKPYTVLGEVRGKCLLDVRQDGFGFAPFVSFGGLLGSLIVSKIVNAHRRTDSDFLFGAIASAGLTYWFQSVGIGLSYGLAMSNIAPRHRIEISLDLSP